MSTDKNRDKFNFYILNASKITTFKDLVHAHAYDKAYALAASASYYRRLPMYKNIEEEFEQTFNMAEMLLVEDEKNVKKAQWALNNYLKVPEKKTVIAALFKAPKIFNAFDELFNEGNYKGFYEKMQEFSAIKEAPIYKEYMSTIDDKIQSFIRFMKERQYEEAYSLSLEMKESLPEIYIKPIQEEFARVEKIREFAHAIREKNYKDAILLVSAHHFLISLDEYSELEKFLNKRFDMAIRYAFHGKVDGVHKYLGKFLTNPYTKQRAVKIYKIAYLHQIDVLGKKMQQPHWKSTFMNYVTRFGIDSEIEALAKKYDMDMLLEKFKSISIKPFEEQPLLGKENSRLRAL